MEWGETKKEVVLSQEKKTTKEGAEHAQDCWDGKAEARRPRSRVGAAVDCGVLLEGADEKLIGRSWRGVCGGGGMETMSTEDCFWEVFL